MTLKPPGSSLKRLEDQFQAASFARNAEVRRRAVEKLYRKLHIEELQRVAIFGLYKDAINTSLRMLLLLTGIAKPISNPQVKELRQLAGKIQPDNPVDQVRLGKLVERMFIKPRPLPGNEKRQLDELSTKDRRSAKEESALQQLLARQAGRLSEKEVNELHTLALQRMPLHSTANRFARLAYQLSLPPHRRIFYQTRATNALRRVAAQANNPKVAEKAMRLLMRAGHSWEVSRIGRHNANPVRRDKALKFLEEHKRVSELKAIAGHGHAQDTRMKALAIIGQENEKILRDVAAGTAYEETCNEAVKQLITGKHFDELGQVFAQTTFHSARKLIANAFFKAGQTEHLAYSAAHTADPAAAALAARHLSHGDLVKKLGPKPLLEAWQYVAEHGHLEEVREYAQKRLRKLSKLPGS